MKLQHLSFVTILTLSIQMVSAQEINLDPVVVSSDFRAEKLSKTASSVSVIDEEKIAENASEPFENLITALPNVNFTSGASRAHYIQIRGIGERSQFATPVNPSVGIMIDGIDFSQSALGITLFDVNQIELLRGPQGTTFGANGLAGVVNIQSTPPSKETTAHAEVTVGNYNKQAAGLAVGGSVIKDKLLGRFSVYKNTSDGFIKNSYLHRTDTNNIDELTLKGALKWLVNDDLSVDLNLIHLDVDNGYDAWTFDNSRTSHADEPGTDAQKTDAFSLKARYQLSPNFHLESAISASKSDLEYSYDEDWSYKGEFADDLYPYSSSDQYLRDRDQNDFDVRLVSDKDLKLLSYSAAWTVGAYMKNFSEDLTRNYTYLDVPYTSTYDTTNLAMYGELDTALSQKTTLVTGVRVENWDATYKDSDSVHIDTDETLVGGKVGIKYQKDATNLLYLTLSKGYKPGGVNADNSLSSAQKSYKTENLYNADLGLISSYHDGAVQSRFNIFIGKRKDQQVKSSVVQVRDDGSTKYTDYLTNAAKGYNFGAEYEIDAYLDTLHLFANVGLLHARFEEYTDPNPDAINVNNRAPAQSPDYQYNVGFDYAFADSFLFSTNVEGKDGYYFSNRHNAKAEGYTLLNSSISTTNGNWTARLWGRNLTDEKYQVRGFGSFGNNPAKAYATEVYTQQGDPRTFGLTVSYDY